MIENIFYSISLVIKYLEACRNHRNCNLLRVAEGIDCKLTISCLVLLIASIDCNCPSVTLLRAIF
jgi:hypothetical protein